MGVNTGGADVAMGHLSSMPLSQIIGEPLKATVEAQAIAATTTVDFIRDVALNEKDNGDLEAVNVSFTYQDSTGITRRLIVPILVILPIPFLEITSFDLAFKAKITASGSTTETDTSSTTSNRGYGFSAGYRGKRFSAGGYYRGSVSSKKDSSATRDSKYSVEYTLDIAIHAGQAGMPAGMSTILKILEDTITARTTDPVLTLSPQGDLKMKIQSSADTEQIGVLVLGADGAPEDGASIAVSDGASSEKITGAANATNSVGKTTLTLTAPTTGSGGESHTLTVTATLSDGAEISETVVVELAG